MAFGANLVRGFRWELFGKISGQGISFVITIVLARLLSPSDFGVLAIAGMVVATASVLIDMGFGSSLVQRRDVAQEHYNAVFYTNVAIGVLLCAGVMGLAGPLANFLREPQLRPVLIACAPSFVINALASVGRTKLYRAQNFAALNLSTVYGTIAGGVLGIAMAVANYGVWSLVAQSLMTAVTVAVYTYKASEWRPTASFRVRSLGELWVYSSRIFASTILGVVFAQIDKLLIGRLANAAQLGYYYRARSLESTIQNVLSQSVLSAMFPALSEIQGDSERFANVVRILFTVLAYVSIFLSGLLYLVAQDIIIILFSDKWQISGSYFQIVAAALFVYPLGALLNTVLASRGDGEKFLRLTVLRYALLLPSYAVLYYASVASFLYAYVILSVIALLASLWFVCAAIAVPRGTLFRPLLHEVLICLLVVLLLGRIGVLNANAPWLNVLATTVVYSTVFLLASIMFRSAGLTALKNVASRGIALAHD